MFQLATNYLTSTGAMSCFSFLKTTMSKDTSCGREKNVGLFQKGQIIGMHQAEKTSKEIAETTKIGLRTVQNIIKNWKDSRDPSSSRKKCGRKKILNDDRDQRSLKRLVKSNCRKTTVELFF
ncbi:hypothetical protein CHARACLAT_030526 [Characodon lateralis]|uniref:HTH psq-type domain-containing protein n=1 Tax=Characodon lateralis TaxID=208331 RepID=A0ABU7ERB6_9TELE|nr:hypothetical protein [Characodon lateralis]